MMHQPKSGIFKKSPTVINLDTTSPQQQQAQTTTNLAATNFATSPTAQQQQTQATPNLASGMFGLAMNQN